MNTGTKLNWTIKEITIQAMNAKIREIAGSIVSAGALILYAITLFHIISRIKGWSAGQPPVQIDDGMKLIVTGLGGLISAVVIATLGVSEPGKAPIGTVKKLSKDYGQIALSVITILYIAVWAILGGYAAYIGVIKYPGASSTMYDIGIAWFGILIGALYAYFGLNLPQPESE
jgi:hypothetical protein